MRVVNYIWPPCVQILCLKRRKHVPFPGAETEEPCDSLRFTTVANEGNRDLDDTGLID